MFKTEGHLANIVVAHLCEHTVVSNEDKYIICAWIYIELCAVKSVLHISCVAAAIYLYKLVMYNTI